MSTRRVFFWQTEKGNKIGPGCLSQWARWGFVVDGTYYRYAEQYMMAEKARMFHDDATLDKIMDAKSPMIIKRLGRVVKGRAGGKWDKEDAAKWDDVRSDVVERGNFAKFSQNDALKEYLLSTGDALLAEASPYDAIWGIGIDAETAEKTPQSKWPGQNLLGKALMNVREKLKSGAGDTKAVAADKKLLKEFLEAEASQRKIKEAESRAKARRTKSAEMDDEPVVRSELECEALKNLAENEKRSSQLFVKTRTTLLRRVNAGDAKAFEEFYNVYCPALLKFVGLAEGAKTERDQWDVVQTVFARFYKTFAMVEDPSTGEKRIPKDVFDTLVRTNKDTGKTVKIKFRQYLITCLKNAVRTKWRYETHKGKMKELSIDDVVVPGGKDPLKGVLIEPKPNPADELERKEREERDAAAMSIWSSVVRGYVMDESLDDCVRDITYRSIAEGVSTDELAKNWGVTKNYAYQIKHRGVKKAMRITMAIYEMLSETSKDIEADAKRLCGAVAAMRPSKHIDKFMVRLAKEILDDKR